MNDSIQHPDLNAGAAGSVETADAAGLPPIMTVEELAQFLRINRDTAYKAVADGKIPGTHRIGRTIRISRDAVLGWLRGQDRVPRSGGKR